MSATFTIHANNGQSAQVTGSYQVLAHGVLGVRPDKGSPFIMSPAGWTQLDIDDAPESGDLLGAGSDPAQVVAT
jgi:hypothetical protein